MMANRNSHSSQPRSFERVIRLFYLNMDGLLFRLKCIPQIRHWMGKNKDPDIFKLVTLKSGSKCHNDEMSENFADAVIGIYQE